MHAVLAARLQIRLYKIEERDPLRDAPIQFGQFQRRTEPAIAGDDDLRR